VGMRGIEPTFDSRLGCRTGHPRLIVLMAAKKHNPLPGFGLTFGFTLFYLSAIVLIPLAALAWRASEMTWDEFWRLATTRQALAAYRITFGAGGFSMRSLIFPSPCRPRWPA
jgi:hypothetical protein